MKHRFMIIVCTASLVLSAACSDDETTTEETTAEGGTAGSGAGASSGEGGGGGEFVCPASASTADCPTMCVAVVAAACPDGPTQAECEQQCADLNAFVGMCPAWGGVVDCAGTDPTYTCMFGESVPIGCEEEFYCLSLCFD